MRKILCLRFVIPLLVLGLVDCPARAQDSNSENFPGENSIILNNCPAIQLSSFTTKNADNGSDFVAQTEVSWQNTSSSSIIAFHLKIEMFDPFNQPINGPGEWLITGHNSANWAPLDPGQSDGDGLNSTSAFPVLTAFVFVEDVRFANGTVWKYDENQVDSDITKDLPSLAQAD